MTSLPTAISHHAQHQDLWPERDEACLQLRRNIRKQRRALSHEFQQQAAAQAQQRLLQLLDELALSGRAVSTMSLYFSCDGELDTSALFTALWQRQIQTYLPVLHPFSPGNLLFLRYQADTPMFRNRFGIPEPRLDVRQLLLPSQLELLLTPLVAFDSKGNRMGMGGGYYDRTLANPQLQALAVGYAHDCQQVATLPLAPWDQQLPIIVTPTRLLDNRTPLLVDC